MSSSSDGSICSSPVGRGTQYTTFDDGLDLDNTLRQQRETFRKQRMEKVEQRRMARQRQQAERKRRQLRGGNGGNDDASASSAGSADLLAEASPLPSPPSSPSSPLRTSRVSNRGGGRRPSNKNARDSNSSSQPLASASAKVNSKAAVNSSDMSPSSILKYKKGRASPSPNRVAFSGLAASRRYSKKGGDANNNANSPVQRKKPWAPRYDSDSEDDTRYNNKNSTSNAAGSPLQRKKPWAPKFDSDSEDEKRHSNKNNTSIAASSPAQRMKPWAPKFDSDPEDDKKYSTNNGKTNNAAGSPVQKTKPWAPKFDSDSDDARGYSKNNGKTNNAAIKPPAQGKNPWAPKYDSDSDNGKMPNGRNNISKQPAIAAMKVATERTVKAAVASRFGSDSESSEDDAEAMIRRLNERNEKGKAAAAVAAAKSYSYNANNSRPALPSSPLKKKQEESQRPAAAPKRHPRLAHLTQDSDDSDEDDESLAGAMWRKLQANKQAEKEASYRHNPLAMEKREQEEREEKRMHNVMDAVVTSKSTTTARTAAGAGGLEGTEIVVGEDAEVKSVSDMGDEAGRRRRGRSKASVEATALEEYVPRKPSRGSYKRRSGGKSGGDDTDEEDSPSNKKQRYSNPSFQSRGRMQDSEDDGLWDDSDNEEKKKGDNDSDSDDDGGKKKRGRGRPRGSKGSTTQPRKRSRSKPKAPSKPADSSDDNDSDAPNQKKKPAPKKKTPKRRSNSADSADDDVEPKIRTSNGSSGRWASKYGADDEDEQPVLDDEVERREHQLKPEFADPKLGPPSPLVPFVLSKTWKLGDPLTSQEGEGDDNPKVATSSMDNDDIDQVPASINRYLMEYQRAGIQFMYTSVIHGKGCILGDDMGLGKTVQLISLIAALLKKTGTGLDELEIHRHRSKVVKAMRAREESKHQALLTGFGIKDESALETIELPRVTPILIIVPPSVVQNWQNEFETWGHFNVGVYSGQSREKALDRIKDGRDYILIVGKSLFIRAADYDQLASIAWKLVIVDEFHEFKNGKTQGYMRLADLRDNSGCPVIGMTGTLMQNNHDELYYLIDLVRPLLLGDIKEFRDEISKPLMYARAKDAKDGVMRLADKQEHLLRRLIKPAYIERKKEEVLKDTLTQKNERVVFCELSEVQKKIYRHIISLPDFELLRFANAPCDCGVNKAYFRGYNKMRTHKEQLNYQRRHKKDLVPQKKCCYKYPFNPKRDEPGEPQIDPDAILWRQAHDKPIGNPDDIKEDILDGKYITCQNCPTCVTFAAMNKLYKISSHPSLLQVDPCESGPDAKKKLDFAQVALTPDVLRELPGGTHWKSDGIMDDHIRLSGKMKTLDYLLRKYFRRRNRVLVFSYSTAALDVIQNHIRGQGWTNLRLDGQTPTSQRQGLVDKFQTDDSIQIFLISTKAGGLGLNLTAANKVIIFDVNWNPSYDEQAQDRAYRIGQKRDVETVRLVARGTIEELIYARQVYKVQLKKQTLGHNTDGKNQPQIFRGVAKDKNRKGELFGLENLLKFKDGSFMSLLWKSSDNPQEEHNVADLAKELENMNDDQLADLAEEGDEGPKDTRKRSQQNASNNGDSDDDNSDMHGMINHQHMFSKSKGGAQIAQGDKDFDEEMGGESQVIEVAAKLACEGIGSDDDDDNDDGEFEDDDQDHNSVSSEYTPPDYEPPAAAIPSPVKSSANYVGRDAMVKSSVKEGGRDTADGETNDDDETVDVPFPSPVKNSANNRGRVTTDGKKSPNLSEDANAESWEKPSSPDRSTADQSTCSFEGLRTQPTTQQPSPKPKAPNGKKSATAKFSLMGTVFENQKKKKDQPAKKKSGGLYIPTYSRK